jgi:hypothetical protein
VFWHCVYKVFINHLFLLWINLFKCLGSTLMLFYLFPNTLSILLFFNCIFWMFFTCVRKINKVCYFDKIVSPRIYKIQSITLYKLTLLNFYFYYIFYIYGIWIWIFSIHLFAAITIEFDIQFKSIDSEIILGFKF